MKEVYLLVILLVLFYVYTYNDGRITVYRFFKPTCPFCVNTQDEWNDFQNNPGREMRVIAIDTSLPQNQGIARMYDVKTVPHIIGVRGRRRYVYEGDRTSKDLRRWSKHL